MKILDRHKFPPSTMTTMTAETIVVPLVKEFYQNNPQIKTSHGIQHIMAVYSHTRKALAAATHTIAPEEEFQISCAALLHDVDDAKYFDSSETKNNARGILAKANVSNISLIIQMIDWVSASHHGNRVPTAVLENDNAYHWLIPRWADRLEAVGTTGVVRCYQYAVEHGHALHSDASPRATSREEVWKHATPERFQEYQRSGGHSKDMISHYYDKLLHVARPPPDIVRNPYLETQANHAVAPLMEVCIQYGKTGVVDEEFFKSLEQTLDGRC